MKVELTGFVVNPSVGKEKQRRVKDKTKLIFMSNYKNGVGKDDGGETSGAKIST